MSLKIFTLTLRTKISFELTFCRRRSNVKKGTSRERYAQWRRIKKLSVFAINWESDCSKWPTFRVDTVIRQWGFASVPYRRTDFGTRVRINTPTSGAQDGASKTPLRPRLVHPMSTCLIGRTHWLHGTGRSSTTSNEKLNRWTDKGRNKVKNKEMKTNGKREKN